MKGSNAYVWKYRTEVRNDLNVPLRITGFDSYSYVLGEWRRYNPAKELYSGVDFAKWYTAGDAATGGWIQPGAVAADGNNWNKLPGPVPPTRIKWIYSAEDASGHPYTGESEVELIPYVKSGQAWVGVDASKLVSVSGRVMDAHYRPPEYAQLHLAGIRGDYGISLEAVVAGEDGSFSMRAEKPRWYSILVYSPWHDRVEIPLVVDTEDRDVSVTVTLAPHDYTQKSGAEALPIVTFGPGESRLQTIWSIDRASRGAWERYYAALEEWRASGREAEKFHFDWSALEAMLKKYMKGSAEPAVRQYAAFELAQLPRKHDAKTASEIITLLPAGSSLWSRGAPLIGFVDQNFETEKRQNIFESLLKENPDRVVRASCLAELIASASHEGKEDLAKRSYETLKTDFGDVGEIQWALKMFDPGRAVVPGRPVPSFEVRSMDNNETISDKTLLGKYYMIDFWAVWCGHCVAEMKDVHAAYRRFKNRNFTILSISFDYKLEDAAKFRKGKWPMPWLNAYVEGGLGSDLARKFEIVGIPKPVLVGPDGKIIAVDTQLRGDDLEKTLKDHLVGSK